MRRALAVLAVVALGMLLAPSTASADHGTAESVTAVFSAQAHVCDANTVDDSQTVQQNANDCESNPTDVFAPVAPAPVADQPCTQQGSTPLCEDGGGDFVFDTELGSVAPDGATCIAVGAGDTSGQNAAVVVNGSEVTGTCRLAATGSFGPIASAGGTDVGAWCGMSHGEGIVEHATVNGFDYADAGHEVTFEWPSSAGTVLPIVFFVDGSPVPSGAGAVQTTGAQPGTCGFGGGATNSFFVTGFSSVAVPA